MVNSHLGLQYERMREAFGDLLDEDRMVENFHRILPDAFEPRVGPCR